MPRRSLSEAESNRLYEFNSWRFRNAEILACHKSMFINSLGPRYLWTCDDYDRLVQYMDKFRDDWDIYARAKYCCVYDDRGFPIVDRRHY